MLMATAPGWMRGRASGLLAGLILVAALWSGSGTSWAQVPPPAKGAAPKGDAEPAPDAPKADEKTKAAAVDVNVTRKSDATEVFADPNAEATRAFVAELPYTGKALTKADVDDVVSGAVGSNRARIAVYIGYYASQLTKKDAIEEMMNLAGRPEVARRIDEASAALARPLRDAQSSQQYKADYTRTLIPVVQQLLKNQMYARIAGMTALSCSTDPAALPVFVAALSDPDQLLAVKVRAAVGISLIAATTKSPLDPASQVIPAANALVDFLDKDQKETHCWPAHFRALQALGWLRTAGNPLRDQGDYAAAALRSLVDPLARPEVRSMAAWALGMMNISRNSARFNFALIGYHCGLLAVDLATRIVAADPTNRERSKALTNQLLFVSEALSGDPSLGSGLMRNGHPNAVAVRPMIEKIAQGVLAEAKVAYELIDAPNTQRPRLRLELTARAGELKTLLGKSSPPDWKLVPEGPEYRSTPPGVAAGDPR